MNEITTRAQLRAFVEAWTRTLHSGALYGLEGSLGVGKTTFVKEVAIALGIQSDVISPTFIYQQTYVLPQSEHGIERLHHYDLYRLASDADAEELGLEFDDPAGIHLVEWIDHVPLLKAHARSILTFVLLPDGERAVTEVCND